MGGTVSKAGVFGTFLLVGLVAYACGAPDDDERTTSAAATVPAAVAPAQVATPAVTSTPAPAPATPGSGASAAWDAPYGVAPEIVTVTSVTDGDTFRVGDRRIRVIGIDSCEAGTTGGAAATAAARTFLSGAGVTLSSEPGVDRDRYGREVRYVHTSYGDFGRLMVPADHTGVYEGGNNASASYLAGLRSVDGGRSACGPRVASVPTRKAPAASAPAADAPSTTAPRPLVRQPAAPSGGAFKNCTAARAAGAAPLYRGQAGYQPKLDRDGDGVACE